MIIGIFGGTFNPVHFGHLRAIEEIREMFNMDMVYFVLSKIPPHKLKENLIPPEERYKILKLALQKNSFFKASPVELRRKKVSYSLNTINYFKKRFYTDKLYFILGSDAFYEIHTWHNYDNILKNIDLIVMKRKNILVEREYLLKLSYKERECFWLNNFGQKIYFANVSRLDISSSKIRKFLKEKKSVNYFLPEKCINYIYKKNFYI